MRPSYNQLLSQISKDSVISFREYNLDRRERKHLVLEVENSVVHDIIPANTPINRQTLEEYYGDNLSDQDYLQLSSINCMRIVLFIKTDENNKPVYKPLLFNRDYYEQGLQEIEVINGVIQDELIYTNSIYSNLNYPIRDSSSPVRVPIILDPNEEEFLCQR